MADHPRAGLRRLKDAAAAGELDAFCERHGILVMSVFGSTAQGAEDPRDLDVAVRLEDDARLLDVLEALVALTGVERLDVLDLNRAGVVARERALVGSIALYEREPGMFERAAVAAMVERMDTDWLRRLDLELMAP